MARIDQLLDEYAKNHGHPTNKKIHWVCVPLIVWSLLGVIWSIPRPGSFNELPLPVNWAVLLVAASMVYYVLRSWPLALGMLVMFALMLIPMPWLAGSGGALLKLSLLVFILAWAGQFIGHVIEGKRPSFFKDLQFLLIGPLWLLSTLYKKLNIPY